MSPVPFYLLLGGMALVAYLFRASFLLFGEDLALPPGLRRALDYVPPAVLAALVLPIFVPAAGWGRVDTARLLAGVLAFAVAYRTRSIPATLAVGMGGLWLALWLLP